MDARSAPAPLQGFTIEAAPDELNASFFAGRADGLRVGSAGHILMALG